MDLIEHHSRRYSFLPGGMPYSSAVIAAPDCEIIRARFAEPVPYRQAFAAIDSWLERHGLPVQSLCAVELRSPASFSLDGFKGFNAEYRRFIEERGIISDGENPVARTNVAPVIDPPGEVAMLAFSFARKLSDGDEEANTFVVSGAAELTEAAIDNDAIIRRGETSREALLDKASYVVQMIARRLSALGLWWQDVSEVSAYTHHELRPLFDAGLLATMGPADGRGVRWVYARPPMRDLEFEMDARGLRQEWSVAI